MSKSPGERLDAYLREHGPTHSELAAKLGRSYQTIYRWTKDLEFNAERQDLVTKELGLPVGYFRTAAASE